MTQDFDFDWAIDALMTDLSLSVKILNTLNAMDDDTAPDVALASAKQTLWAVGRDLAESAARNGERCAKTMRALLEEEEART